ncbi:MAG: hypothetical protein LQ350_003511 [Teloschistes chrysophthalmus]|nr:MAG: hypothetical protein LQ350_003511 [Niorma chrysophthalma]
MVGTKSDKLEDQAATAALYVTRANKKDHPKSDYPLDEDNKLSSAGAATSLKYANPRDLPSFPVIGLEHGEAGAGAAASLANANHREFEHWKPSASAPASKAAMLAKDYKPAPLWHPEDSAAGSKAANLAAREGAHVDIWLPESTSAGNSAAGQAMRAKGLSPQVFRGSTADDNRKALLAATGAMSGSRKRAGSQPALPPPSYPDSANSAANALKAATSVSRSKGSAGQPKSPPPVTSSIDAARIHNAAVTNLSREMYTANPPVAPEVEEKRRQEGLRAAAVSMAKQMYEIQQRAIDEAASDGKGDSHYAATSVHNRQPSVASNDEKAAPRYVNLQEAAQKLAAERLSKLHDEHAAYRNYYGATQPVQKRLSIRARPRRRASSDGSTPQADEERSRQIRNQMSLFKDELAQVDAKKRQSDRDALMAAAQRNVRASMTGMDEQVFNDTGKASPAMMAEWEAKAKARAKADSDARMVNHGRVNIGGGKYLDQSEVDAIAAGKVQPTLDEITAKAEKQRARDEELRRQQEERERVAAEKVADQKERDVKTKEEWKRFRGKAKKEDEKARKAEEKRFREEERRKSKAPEAALAPEAERPMTSSEPPVLDPIPSVDPLDPEDEDIVRPQLRTTVTEEIRLQAAEEKRKSVLIEGSKVTEDTTKALPSSEHTDAEDVAIATSSPLEASKVAERVFSSPIVDPSEEISIPVTQPGTTTSVKPEPTTNSPAAAAEPLKAKPVSTEAKSQEVEPVHHRVALPAATTETTVTGPPSSQKQSRSEGKVSSWLKNKLRRSSKPAKPEGSKADRSKSASNEKGFVGGASLTGATTSASKSSTEPSNKDDSVREVAMAGKSSDTGAPPAATSATASTTPAPAQGAVASDSSDDDDELYASSTKDQEVQPQQQPQQHQRSHSSSPVSSLSSDEGEHPRGRSQLRREVTESSNPNEEFEEARDTFESEKLAPPAPLKDTAGRASDSPIRDSKFSEDL